MQVFNERVADSQGIITLPALPAGTELEVTVTGHNALGESAPTAAVTGVRRRTPCDEPTQHEAN